MLKIEEFTLGPLAQHPLVIWDDITKEAILIDVGFEDGSIEKFLEQNILQLKALYNTHAHIDHVGAVYYFQEKFQVPFLLGDGEEVVLEYAPLSAQKYQYPLSGMPQVTASLREEEIIKIGRYSFSIIATPGHTPGGICFYCASEDILVAGDTLFAGSIGRTDLPGGDYHLIMQSLEKLKQLPTKTKIYCGHGPQTTIGQELANNPFLT